MVRCSLDDIPVEALPFVDNAWKGCEIGLLYVDNRDAENSSEDGRTLFAAVIEPDVLVDVTDVADCVLGPDLSVPSLAILRRFQPRRPIAAAAAGSLVNAMFDLLAADPTLDDIDVVRRAYEQRALQWAALRHAGEPVDNLVEKARGYLGTLRRQIDMWGAENIRTEVAISSPAVGLQGRLDIVVDGEVIEMKAGKPPSRGVRPGHEAQAAAYALMSEVIGTPSAATSVWYVASEAQPMRRIDVDAAQLLAVQRRIIMTRNAIVAMDRAMAERDFDVLRAFDGRSTSAVGLAAEFERDFARIYRRADTVSRTAMQAWTSYIQRERRAAASGPREARFAIDNLHLTRLLVDGSRLEGSPEGASTVEGPPADDQQVTRLLVVGSDDSRGDNHVHLTRPSDIDVSSLRVGDMVVLSREGASSALGRTVIKGTLREFGRRHVVVSIRTGTSVTLDAGPYRLEQDVTDSGLRQMMPGLLQFLDAPDRRRAVLLGLEPPRCDDTKPVVVPDELTAEQAEILQRALAARDYFLLQGPPGTGKTNIMLKHLVARLHADPNERVLVAAFTNRAVSEICDALAGILPHSNGYPHGAAPPAFLRHGTKGGIPLHQRAMSVERGLDRLADTRVIVSTIASLHSSPEILSFGRFTTAVIDEAAQVLEPQIIGLLSSVDRAILIGDHAQLPAVVTQDAAGLRVDSPLLAASHLTDLGMSTFERLFRCCEAHGWEGATATLTAQGRMHADVMAVASEAFYGGALTTLFEAQRTTDPLPWQHVVPHRAAVLDVKGGREAERRAVIHIVENIVHSARNVGMPITIGIITPFRMQNRALELELQHLENVDLTIDTIERFQGSQRDVVIYSTSVENPAEFASIQAEAEVHGRLVDRRLNVACTRGREQFLLVGNTELLRKSSAYACILETLRIFT